MVHEDVKKLPSIPFIIVGIFLLGAVATISFLGSYLLALVYTDFFGNATLLTWNRLVNMSLPIVFVLSLAYFSRRQIKHLMPIQLALITLIFLITSSIRMAQISEQKQILQNYQQFMEFVRRGKTTDANLFMLPANLLASESLDFSQHTWLEQAIKTENISSLFSVHIRSNNRAFIVPDPKTNRWYHPVQGFFLELEKIENEWYFTGDGGLYLAD